MKTSGKQLRVQTQVRAGVDRCKLCKLSCLLEWGNDKRQRCEKSCDQMVCRK